MFIYDQDGESKSKEYWSKKFDGFHLDWEEWYNKNFVNKLIPRKICDFNWRIFYGQVNTEKRLKIMNLSDRDCSVCKNEIENLEHLFIHAKML
jgi:hypothetical protein